MGTKIVVDTSGFFASAALLRALVEGGAALSVPDLVVFEFIKAVREEASLAERKGNKRRASVMASIEKRFPQLLRALEIEIWTSTLSLDNIREIYDLVAQAHEPGDSMIWVKMKNAGLDTIATANPDDWRALGANVVPLV